MQARVLTGQLKQGAMEELQQIFAQAAQAETTQQAGYQGAILLGDKRTGKVLLITLWDAAEAMRAGEQSGYLQAQIAKVGHLLLGSQPTKEHYEVGLELGTLGARAAGAAARVTAGQTQPGKLPEIYQGFGVAIAPAAQAQSGFIGLLVLGNTAANKNVVVSLWQSDAAMHANEQSGYFHGQMEKLAHLYAGPPTREHFVVLSHL